MKFFRGECVDSRMHGFGRVIVGGSTPTVRFLDGREGDVPTDELRLLTDEAFEAELLNRTAWERHLNWRVYGVVEPAVPTLPQRLDLATALRHELEFEWPRDAEPPWPSGFQFVFHDLNRPSVPDSGSGIASASIRHT